MLASETPCKLWKGSWGDAFTKVSVVAVTLLHLLWVASMVSLTIGAASDILSILKHMSELISFGNAFDSLQNAPALLRFSFTVQPTSEKNMNWMYCPCTHAVES